MKKRQYIIIIVVGFLLLLLTDILLLNMEYKNYQDKMEILYTILTNHSAESDINKTITGLLKGKDIPHTKEAKEQLDQYGFTASYKDAYKKILNKHQTAIIYISCMLYTVFLLLLYIIYHINKKNSNKEMNILKEIIVKLRDGNLDLNQINHTELSPDITHQILMDLESLASHIKVIKYQASKEKEETKSLVTDISHQLRTPIAALKISFDILENNNLTQAEKEEFEARCKEQIKRLNELVSALINISRMETGMIEIKRESCSIFNTMVSAIERIYPNAEEKQIEISLESEDELQNLMIPHDSKWMAEAVINILENAIKYSKSHTSVVIRMIKMINFLRIEIEDEGIGINKKERNKIFQRFYRIDSTVVKQISGSGVGLYLTREIISHHNGTVSVYTPTKNKNESIDKGSLFVLQIPYK